MKLLRAIASITALAVFFSVFISTVSPVSAQALGSVVYRVNAGGGLVSDTPDWGADNPSPYLNTGSKTYVGSNTIELSDPSVPVGTLEAIFQSERYDPSGGTEMQWDFPVTDGDYEVTLPFAEVGADTGVVKTFTTTCHRRQQRPRLRPRHPRTPPSKPSKSVQQLGGGGLTPDPILSRFPMATHLLHSLAHSH